MSRAKTKVTSEQEQLTAALDLWSQLAPTYEPNAGAVKTLAKWIRQFGVSDVLAAMREAQNSLVYEEDGSETVQSWNASFNKIPSIVVVNQRAAKDPDAKRKFYIRGILRNRLAGKGYYYRSDQAMEWIEAATSWEIDLDDIEDVVKHAGSWTQFVNRIAALIEAEKNREA